MRNSVDERAREGNRRIVRDKNGAAGGCYRDAVATGRDGVDANQLRKIEQVLLSLIFERSSVSAG